MEKWQIVELDPGHPRLRLHGRGLRLSGSVVRGKINHDIYRAFLALGSPNQGVHARVKYEVSVPHRWGNQDNRREKRRYLVFQAPRQAEVVVCFDQQFPVTLADDLREAAGFHPKGHYDEERHRTRRERGAEEDQGRGQGDRLDQGRDLLPRAARHEPQEEVTAKPAPKAKGKKPPTQKRRQIVRTTYQQTVGQLARREDHGE